MFRKRELLLSSGVNWEKDLTQLESSEGDTNQSCLLLADQTEEGPIPPHPPFTPEEVSGFIFLKEMNFKYASPSLLSSGYRKLFSWW
jgi:hypothetical protein